MLAVASGDRKAEGVTAHDHPDDQENCDQNPDRVPPRIGGFRGRVGGVHWSSPVLPRSATVEVREEDFGHNDKLRPLGKIR